MEKKRAVWRRLTRVLSREGATLRVSGILFKAVVQLVLIFGTETWVVTPPHGPGPGGITGPGGATVNREATTDKE